MRARESWRPSARPLKVGRKPKLTSNKVFEVVQGGSWETAFLRGRLGGGAVNYSCLIPGYSTGQSRQRACGSRLCRHGKGGEVSTPAAFPVPLRSPALGLSVALFGEGVANLESFVTFPSPVC